MKLQSFFQLGLLVLATPTMAAIIGSREIVETRQNPADGILTLLNGIVATATDLTSVVQSLGSGGGLVGLGNLLNPIVLSPLVQDVQTIVTRLLTALTSLNSPGGSSGLTNQAALCNALLNVVTALDPLLNAIIGQTGILQTLGLGAVATLLSEVENLVNTLGAVIVSLVPTCGTQAQQQLATLNGTFLNAVCGSTPIGTLPIIGGLICVPGANGSPSVAA